MKPSKIIVGMKVIPFKKSTGYRGFNDSTEWNTAKQMGQPFLYVIGTRGFQGKIVYSLAHSLESGGDYFLPEDFEPYKGDDNATSKDKK